MSLRKLLGRKFSLFIILGDNLVRVERVINSEKEYIQSGYNPELKKANNKFIEQINGVYFRI